MRMKGQTTTTSARPALLVWVVFINGFATIALLALLAMVWRVPLVFPSLGPTAFLLFASPDLPPACARNTLCGHAIGILCGYGALWLTGLQHAPSAMLEGVNLARVVAAALSLASTGALMILFGVVHSPAGATTLIIARNHHAPIAPDGHRSGGCTDRHSSARHSPAAWHPSATVVATNRTVTQHRWKKLRGCESKISNRHLADSFYNSGQMSADILFPTNSAQLVAASALVIWR
jgi:HPP family